jgi:hypothetical protein
MKNYYIYMSAFFFARLDMLLQARQHRLLAKTVQINPLDMQPLYELLFPVKSNEHNKGTLVKYIPVYADLIQAIASYNTTFILDLTRPLVRPDLVTAIKGYNLDVATVDNYVKRLNTERV